MRRYKEDNKIGDKRTVTKFCFLPTHISYDNKSMCVWLENIKIEQEYYVDCDQIYGITSGWEDTNYTLCDNGK